MKTYKGYKKIILDHLAKNPKQWFKVHELQSVHLDGKWVGTRGGRDCRDLASNHAVDVRYVGDKRYVEYKHKEATTGQISAIETMPVNNVIAGVDLSGSLRQLKMI